MSRLLHQTLVELTDTLKAKRASPVDLMTETLDRVDDTHDRLNAVVSRYERDDLLAEARAAEERIAKGEARPLEGVPFGVKDCEDLKGLATTWGSRLFSDAIAEGDSIQVERLRAAGAIPIGHTNMSEFGTSAITGNRRFGTTRSPWDPERTPGGSSGGSSAAIAAEVLPLATAADGGGSVRLPASMVGAFGLKPTYGRIPIGPVERYELGGIETYGPLTKTVEDAALVLDVVAGPDPHDPRSLPHSGLSYLEKVREPFERKLRIGYSPDFGHAVVQSDVAAAVDDSVRVFEQLGHTIEPLKADPPYVAPAWATIGLFEVAAHFASFRPEREGDVTRWLMEAVRLSESIDQEAWGASCKARASMIDWCAGVFEDYDLIVSPTLPYDPPPAKGPYPTETEGRPQLLMSVASFTLPFNLAWNPAATVRAGLSKAGLPIGMQIAGRHHEDEIVLQAARAFERERPWHPSWPMR